MMAEEMVKADLRRIDEGVWMFNELKEKLEGCFYTICTPFS